MNLRYLYTSFEGRINRQPFWIASLILFVVAIVVSFAILMPISAANTTMGALAGLILSLAFLYPGAALGVKRLHDRGKSGLLMAVFIAPGLISQLCDLLGITGSYQTIAGQSIHMPNTLGWILNLVTLGVAIWALVTLGFLKGTSGANSYGPDPLMGEAQEAVPGCPRTGLARSMVRRPPSNEGGHPFRRTVACRAGSSLKANPRKPGP